MDIHISLLDVTSALSILSEAVNLMRARLRGITWRSYSKTFLKRNCSSGKTTEEKSAEVSHFICILFCYIFDLTVQRDLSLLFFETMTQVSKEAWPSIRKYSPIWIPAMLAVVVTVDVCNNTYHRTVIESYAPPYSKLLI